MKVKTFTDKRTFTEKTGIPPEQWTDWPNIRISIGTSEEEQAERDKLIKPPPKVHIFDIELSSMDKGKEPELLFTETLFCYYWLFKNSNHYTTKELRRIFTVRKFCQHHEVEKADLNKIILASYEMAYHHQKAYQSDRYRPEILQQIDLYLKERPTDRPELERMFKKAGDLKTLVKLLTNKGYLENGYVWTKEPIEFAAMAKACTPLLHKSHLEKPTALHRAWTGYFKSDNGKPIVSVQYFKPVKWPELLPHEKKFAWISFEFDIE